MKKLLPLIFSALVFNLTSTSQATHPFTTCPDVNIAVARAGLNTDTTNPYYIYSVNTISGAVTQFAGGPLVNPNNHAANLQVNAVGVNKIDGYLYGLDFEGTVNTARFARFDYTYGVTLLGDITPPTSASGLLGFVNSAAGDIDRSDNYYFTGFTANPTSPTTYALDKLFLGKISSISTLSGTPTPTYFEIDYSDANCSAYISTLTSDPNNSGVKDITYSPFSGTFFIYATYKPTGAANFSGELIELKPIAGSSPLKYKMFCNAIVNTHTAETSGSLIDNSGNFLVLLTDGSIGKLQTSGTPFNYTGGYTNLNNATGLPGALRGDMASCSSSSGAPLAITLSSFKANASDCKINFSWTSENEINLSHYELEQSFDNITFSGLGMVNAKNINASSPYTFTLSSVEKLAYYRLKMVNIDGKFYYSNIIPVNNSCNKKQHGFVINSNIVSQFVNVSWYGITNATTMKVNVYNAFGLLVSSVNTAVNAGSSVININAANLPAGIYSIKCIDLKTNETFQERFVKQ